MSRWEDLDMSNSNFEEETHIGLIIGTKDIPNLGESD